MPMLYTVHAVKKGYSVLQSCHGPLTTNIPDLLMKESKIAGKNSTDTQSGKLRPVETLYIH